MVVGGTDHVVGYKPMRLAKLLMTQAEAPSSVEAQASRVGTQVTVTVTGTGATGTADIVLVRYLKERSVDIRRGENAGRSLTYHNIVADMRRIGTWDGQGTTTAQADADGDGQFAIIVQRPNAGPILAAAKVR